MILLLSSILICFVFALVEGRCIFIPHCSICIEVHEKIISIRKLSLCQLHYCWRHWCHNNTPSVTNDDEDGIMRKIGFQCLALELNESSRYWNESMFLAGTLLNKNPQITLIFQPLYFTIIWRDESNFHVVQYFVLIKHHAIFAAIVLSSQERHNVYVIAIFNPCTKILHCLLSVIGF